MFRSAVREITFRSGLLNGLHRTRNRENLTVVMFHRVLPSNCKAAAAADPAYTVAPEFLQACLSFFGRNYTLVSVEDVVLSRQRIRPLPAWPLLITFDDGWRDNYEWAKPILRGHPWTLFVAGDAVREGAIWWQETLLWALRSGERSADALAEAINCSESGAPLPSELKLLLRFAALPASDRNKALEPFSRMLVSNIGPRLMLSTEEIMALRAEGVGIGCHGMSHLPLTQVPNPVGEMRESLQWLSETLEGSFVPTMSFPHGRWNDDLAQAAKAMGYQIVFTSSPVLNPCPSGWLQSDIIGRIPIAHGPLTDRLGTFSPARMSRWLYGRASVAASPNEM